LIEVQTELERTLEVKKTLELELKIAEEKMKIKDETTEREMNMM
jgi:hypothetical protein